MNPQTIKLTSLGFLALILGTFLPLNLGSTLQGYGARSPEGWKAQGERSGETHKLVVWLNYSKGLSAEFTKARGKATLNLLDSTLSVEIAGLSERKGYDVWLVDNRLNSGIKAELGDNFFRAGSLYHENGVAKLEKILPPKTLKEIQLDLLVVTRTGDRPGKTHLLIGSLNLFQQL